MIDQPYVTSSRPQIGSVLAALLSQASADDVLRDAFAEADRRGVVLDVLITAGAPGEAAARRRRQRARGREPWQKRSTDEHVAPAGERRVEKIFEVALVVSRIGRLT